MQTLNWLLRAIWWSCSGERILQSGETQGWRTKNGEDQEPRAPGPDAAPDERRPNP